MFWHRRKLLEIEEQIKTLSGRMDETVAKCFTEINKKNDSLQDALSRIEDCAIQLEQGQKNILDLLALLKNGQRTGQGQIASWAESQRDSIDQLFALISAQDGSMKMLNEVISEVKTSVGDGRKEGAFIEERILNRLQGTEHAITEKVENQSISVVECQNNSEKLLSNAIVRVMEALKQSQQQSLQFNDQMIEVLQGVERAIGGKVDGQVSVVQTSITEFRKAMLEQDHFFRQIDGTTRAITDSMDTLDEAMRLLLINTLLNNIPGK